MKYAYHTQVTIVGICFIYYIEDEYQNTVVPGFSVLCPSPQNVAPNPGSALNPGKSTYIMTPYLVASTSLHQGIALNPRTLNRGTTVI